MSRAWRSALCYSSLGPTFSPTSAEALGTCYTSLAKKQSCKMEVWPAPSALCCFCFPLLQREKAPPPLGKCCSKAYPFPAVAPECPWGLPSNILLSKTDAAWRSLSLISPWEDTSQLGTIWSPSDPTFCSKQGLRSWWGFAVSMDLCHPNFPPCPNSICPASLTLPVSKFRDASVARCVL